MIYDPTPVTPSNLVPANKTVFDQATTNVTLSWQDTVVANTEVNDTEVNTIIIPAPLTRYSVRVTDWTEPELRHAGNNCQAKKQYVCRDALQEKTLTIVVHPTHAYSWEVFKSVEYSYLDGAGNIRKSRIRGENAAGTFRVGVCNAAEIVNVAVPEIIAPGAVVHATVVVRNVGSTTWTKESGYRLGSLSPNAMVWGISRVNLKPGVPVMPGQLATFSFPVTAPQNPGKYFFQWRMIFLDSVWFGASTTNRYLKVGSPTTIGAAWAKRDPATGSLGALITLRGGNYHIFEKDSEAQRKLVADTTAEATILKNYQDVMPCAPAGLGSSKLKVWENKPLNTWGPLFTTLFNRGDNRANLLRVFLMNGFGIMNPGTGNEAPNEVYPFILAGNNSSRRWLVKKAITDPNTATNWNALYFTRLKAFAEQARLKGVFLQLSLFNYYEMSDDTWNFSIWNPARSDDRDWGAKNLVNPQLPNPHPPPATFACSNARSTAEGTRHCFFIEAPLWSGLRKVQEQFVRKVVRELHGKPNIILEVMNEPRGGSHESSARFASTVIDWIIDEGHPEGTPPWRPLISVNASLQRGLDPTDPDQTDPDRSDVDWWGDPVTNPRDADPNLPPHVKNYEEIDIISYHGLSGYGAPNLPFRCSPSASTQYRPIYYVDLKSIRDRIAAFRSRHPSKALMLSTDSVRFAPYNHVYGHNDMDLRDGQITTNLNHGGRDYYEQMTRSDLNDWAFWCFQAAREKQTTIHFQNHSNFEAPYAYIDQAYRASLL